MISTISVIIPVFNVEKYLQICLDSVANQTYPDLQVIVVDDGSTDGSGKICDEFARRHENFSVFHTDNKGLSAARNYGLDNISGRTEFIFFLDSDDWLEKDTIQIMHNAAIHSGSDIVECGFYEEYPNGQRYAGIQGDSLLLEGDQIQKTFVSRQAIKSYAWNKLYKKSLFNNIRYPEGRLYEDIATTYKIIDSSNSIYIISDSLIHYRIRRDSLSTSHNMKQLLDYWLSNIEMYRYISLKYDYDCSPLISTCIQAIGRMWRWYHSCSNEEKKNAKKDLDEMQEFVSEHYKEIMKSQKYTFYDKVCCFTARYRSPLLFRLLFIANKISKMLHTIEMYN